MGALRQFRAITGGADAALSGGNVAREALSGAVIGGITRGLAEGIGASIQGNTFWNGWSEADLRLINSGIRPGRPLTLDQPNDYVSDVFKDDLAILESKDRSPIFTFSNNVSVDDYGKTYRYLNSYRTSADGPSTIELAEHFTSGRSYYEIVSHELTHANDFANGFARSLYERLGSGDYAHQIIDGAVEFRAFSKQLNSAVARGWSTRTSLAGVLNPYYHEDFTAFGYVSRDLMTNSWRNSIYFNQYIYNFR